ncbi:unnamed protein product [Rhizophagus irregularis]|uniref:Uncharacterized protein n=1 Tax=Rhizophagus irregularis TaxID=588596 RepID=A0A915YUE7_9GLOM|nr:unnamed protein product [Rhizophagus irregularis]CAB5343087.1 unnamed protein product [Rhizophagus irregularis]
MPAKFVAFCYVNDSTERLTQEYTVKEITDVTRTDDDYPTKSHQCKLLKSTKVSQTMFDHEHKKQLIREVDLSSDVDKFPSLSAIVDGNHWYFAPFAGRAFLLVRSDQLNANKTKLLS